LNGLDALEGGATAAEAVVATAVRYHGRPRLTQSVAGSGTIRPAGTAI
jgi:hypothetical protein